jgi:hypothetical protein
MEKIRANRVIRFKVYPINEKTNRVRARVTGIAIAATAPALHPMNSAIRIVTEMAARNIWNSSSLFFSLAVSP